MSTWAQRSVDRFPKRLDGSPFAVTMLKPEDLPISLESYDEETGELVWETTIHEAGELRVPGFHPRPVCVLVSFHRSGSRVFTSSNGYTFSWSEPA